MDLLEQQIEAAILLDESIGEMQKSMNMIVEKFSMAGTEERGHLQALLLSLMKLCRSTARLEYVHQKLLKDDKEGTENNG